MLIGISCKLLMQVYLASTCSSESNLAHIEYTRICMLIGLAATSGGEGDNQILLWNVQSGQLASDLNLGYRSVFEFIVISF